MGKVDDLRALREANWAARQKVPAGPSRGHRAQSAGAEGGRRDAATVAEALCGHTAIGGKRCIRPKDHAEKNHRYGKETKS